MSWIRSQVEYFEAAPGIWWYKACEGRWLRESNYDEVHEWDTGWWGFFPPRNHRFNNPYDAMREVS
jgi:hypothetical protein